MTVSGGDALRLNHASILCRRRIPLPQQPLSRRVHLKQLPLIPHIDPKCLIKELIYWEYV